MSSKEEFEKWVYESEWADTILSYEKVFGQAVWHAACEYKHKEIEKLEAENTELTKLVTEFENNKKNIRKDAVIYCIKKLRDLQNKHRHQSIWNHSNDPKFAPVELSDYLFINVLREMDDL